MNEQELIHIRNRPVTPEFIAEIADARPSEAWLASIFMNYLSHQFCLIFQPTGDIKDNLSPSVTDYEIPIDYPNEDIESLYLEVTLYPNTKNIPKKARQYAALENIRKKNPRKRHLEVSAGAMTQPEELASILLQVLSGEIKLFHAQKNINNMHVVLPEGRWSPEECPNPEQKQDFASFIKWLINAASRYIDGV